MKTTGPTHVCSSLGASLPLGDPAASIHFMRTGFIGQGGTTWRVSDIKHRRHLSHRFDFSCYVPEEKTGRSQALSEATANGGSLALGKRSHGPRSCGGCVMDKKTLEGVLADIHSGELYDWGRLQETFANQLLMRLAQGEELMPSTNSATLRRMGRPGLPPPLREAFHRMFFACCVSKNPVDQRRGMREAGALMRLAMPPG